MYNNNNALVLLFDELDDDDVIHTALIYIYVEEKINKNVSYIIEKTMIIICIFTIMFKNIK